MQRSYRIFAQTVYEWVTRPLLTLRGSKPYVGHNFATIDIDWAGTDAADEPTSPSSSSSSSEPSLSVRVWGHAGQAAVHRSESWTPPASPLADEGGEDDKSIDALAIPVMTHHFTFSALRSRRVTVVDGDTTISAVDDSDDASVKWEGSVHHPDATLDNVVRHTPDDDTPAEVMRACRRERAWAAARRWPRFQAWTRTEAAVIAGLAAAAVFFAALLWWKVLSLIYNCACCYRRHDNVKATPTTTASKKNT